MMPPLPDDLEALGVPPSVADGPRPADFPGVHWLETERGRVRYRCCLWCGAPFRAKTIRRRYCASDCRTYHWRWLARRSTRHVPQQSLDSPQSGR